MHENMDTCIWGQQPIEAEPFMKPVTKKIAPDYDKGPSFLQTQTTRGQLIDPPFLSPALANHSHL
jgi:hypothetical protein